MDLLTRVDLRTLAKEADGWHVSIYMPTHRAGDEIQQDPIRLKNLLEETRENLRAAGLGALETRELLAPAEELLSDGPFWQQQGDGLALYLAPDRLRYYRLPVEFESLTVVADRFHVKPLLPLYNADGRFYVLALSQQEVRLFQGTSYAVGEVDLATVPSGLGQALRYDDPERQLQYHTSTRTPGGAGDRPATFHGQGVGENDQKADIERYFQKVDEGLHPTLREERAPLVLAGVEYLLPIYRQASTYPHLVEGEIEGNPETWSGADLHRRAWDIVRPIFAAGQREAKAQYQALAGAGDERASSDPAAVVPAAHYGRVDALLLARGAHAWGAFDAQANDLHMHEEREPGDEDLLDVAAVQVLLSGGTVYALDPVDMPGEATVAAVFRY